MPDAITVKGDREAARMLRRIGERARHQRATFEQEGRSAQRRISGIPVATGRLARSVRGASTEGDVKATDRGYVITTSVPYARFVFGGTERMPARPPRIPGDLGRRAARGIADDITR